MTLKEKITNLLDELNQEKKQELETALDVNFQNEIIPQFQILDQAFEEAKTELINQAAIKKEEENKRHLNAINNLDNELSLNLDEITKKLNLKKQSLQEASEKTLTTKIEAKYLSNQTKLNDLLNNILD